MSQPEPIQPPVVATLCLPTVKAGATFRVTGACNKPYEFRRHPRHQTLVREYTSLETFYREEKDIRMKLGSPYVITTLLGVTHPVVQAKEAVAKLIASAREVDISQRSAALREIIDAAQGAIILMEQQASGGAPSSPVPVAPAPSPRTPAVEFPNTRWKDESTGLPVEGDKPAPVANGQHTQADLMTGEWEEVKLIAKGLEIKLTKPTGGAKGRPELVNEILMVQRQLQPA